MAQKSLLLLIFTLLMAGCGSTREHRIRQFSMAFEAMEPEERDRIREGRIEKGFSPLQVYLALGPPNRSGEFRPPPVDPGDRWFYMGYMEDDIFRSSYEWVRLPSGGLSKMTIEFGEEGVREVKLEPVD